MLFFTTFLSASMECHLNQERIRPRQMAKSLDGRKEKPMVNRTVGIQSERMREA